MKKNWPLFFLAFALTAAAAAAENGIEKLKRELALNPGAKRQAIAVKLVTALTARGDQENSRQNYKAALASYGEALALLKEFPDLSPSPHLLNKTGLIKLISGDYDRALDLLLQALSAAEKAGDRKYVTQSAYLIGYAHRDLGNIDLSLRHFQMAHESAQAGSDPYYTIMSLNEIGNVHVYRKRFDQAMPFKERALSLARKHNQPSLLAACLHDMGHLHLSRDQAAKALPFLQESLVIHRQANMEREIIITLINLADGYSRLGRFTSALASLDEALVLAERRDLTKSISDILSMYSIVYESMNDHRHALEFQRRYHDLWREIFSQEKSKQIAEMQTRYDVEKKQRENELLKREKQIAALALGQQRSQRDFLFFVALLVLLLAAVLYRGFFIKSRANRKLEAANNQIVAQQARLEDAYHQMEKLARRDQLTGLPNRRAAMEELEREERRFQRSRKPFSLVMADLVGFKAVNDSLGHDAGDQALKAAAALFTGALRAQDTAVRWGGDEFLFLLPETDAEGAQVTCESIRRKVADHDIRFSGRRLEIGISLGAATFRAGLTIEECLREADQAMYRGRQH